MSNRTLGLVTPKWLPLGTTVRARRQFRLATCQEVGCNGCDGLHKVPTWERPIYFVNDKPCTEDEFIQRVGAIIEAIVRIRTRGV